MTAHTRFGTLVVPEDRVIHLPAGLAGCPTSQRFVLLERSASATLRWLQCLDPSGPTFLVVDPFLVDPNYPLEDVRSALGQLGIDGEKQGRAP